MAEETQSPMSGAELSAKTESEVQVEVEEEGGGGQLSQLSKFNLPRRLRRRAGRSSTPLRGGRNQRQRLPSIDPWLGRIGADGKRQHQGICGARALVQFRVG
jgi:hypothetical protein